MKLKKHKIYPAKARYFASCPGDEWLEIKASTLRGAKRAALNMYQVSNGGRIELGEFDRDICEIEMISTKDGYNAWSDNK